MIENLKIGPRLGLAFGMILLFLIAISLFGTTRLSLVNDSTSSIVKNRFPKITLGTSLLAAVKDMSVDMRNLLIAEDPQRVSVELAAINQRDREMESYMTVLSRL